MQEQEDIRLEHVIVDGGSEDGTLELIRSIAGRHPQVVVSEPDDGIYDAMNKGIRRARGKYIVFLNSDDFYHDKDGLRLSVAELERTGADFSYAPAVVINELGRFSASSPHVTPHPDDIFTQMEFSHQSMLTRRAVFERLGGFDLAYRSSSDYDFVLRMVFAGCKACFVPQSFVTFVMGGYSLVNLEMANREVAQIYSRHYSRQGCMTFSEGHALYAYLHKTLPSELAKALSPFARVTFGEDARPRQRKGLSKESGWNRRQLLDFRRYQLPAHAARSRIIHRLTVMCCIVRHPILSGRYFLICRKIRDQVHELRVKPVAYDELFYRVCGTAVDFDIIPQNSAEGKSTGVGVMESKE